MSQGDEEQRLGDPCLYISYSGRCSSLFSLAHVQYATTSSPPTSTASWFTVSLPHPPPSALLSICIPPCAFLSEAHRHGSICSKFSFPVWGVYHISCSRAQLTSNTRAAQKPRERERRIHIKHVKENVDGRGDQRVRPKSWLMTDTMTEIISA